MAFSCNFVHTRRINDNNNLVALNVSAVGQKGTNVRWPLRHPSHDGLV